MAEAFLNRGYPSDLVETAVIKERRMDRGKLLAPIQPKTEKDDTKNKMFLIATYNSGQNILGNIIEKHLPYLVRNSNFRVFNDLTIVQAYRRLKTLKVYLVRASIITQKTKKPDKKQCKNPAKCRYCPKINKSGKIVCSVTNRTYYSKINVNLIYVITCLKCLKQYVGQTDRRLMDRFQGHFGSIRSEETTTLINDHFNREDHESIKDFEIHIVDFIRADAKSASGKELYVSPCGRHI